MKETDELIMTQENAIKEQELQMQIEELNSKLSELEEANERLKLHNQKLYSTTVVAKVEKKPQEEEPEYIDEGRIRSLWKGSY